VSNANGAKPACPLRQADGARALESGRELTRDESGDQPLRAASNNSPAD
jgi:hypothetical protein